MTELEKMMSALGLTEEEARELMEDDKRIDKGEKLFSLTAEQEKASKKARGTGTKKPTVYNFEKRKRKENPDKNFLVSTLVETLRNTCEKVEAINPEREIEFYYNNVKYKLVLSVPRGKKEEG